MIKKIFLFLVILAVVFIVLAFQVPTVTKNIESTLGMSGITDKILNFKGTYDHVVTDIPGKQDVVNTYNTLASGAIDAKNTVVDTANTTKQKVDEVRKTLSGAQDTVNDTIKTAQKTKEDLEKLQKLGQDIVKIVSTGSTNTTTSTTAKTSTTVKK